MAYKSLLTVITQAEGLEQTLAAAGGLAASLDAHLEVLCLATEQTHVGFDIAGGDGALLQRIIDSARNKAIGLERAVRGQMATCPVRWGVDSAAVPAGGLMDAVCERARYCDVMVQQKPFGKSMQTEAEVAIEAALFGARSPVLVLPDHKPPELPGKRIVVAWNRSQEAMAAVRAALPLLVAAQQVNVMIVDPSSLRGERSDPGGALSQMLARHNVRVEVAVLAKTLPRFCDMLNRHARDTAADMVVMGAYGHSRLRESILGGATRDMLELAEVPVFMAH